MYEDKVLSELSNVHKKLFNECVENSYYEQGRNDGGGVYNYEKLPDGKVRAYSYEGIEMVNGERCFLIAQGEDDDERFMAVNRYAVGTGENAKIYYDDIVTCMYQEVAEVIDGGKAIRLLADEKN